MIRLMMTFFIAAAFTSLALPAAEAALSPETSVSKMVKAKKHKKGKKKHNKVAKKKKKKHHEAV